METPLFISPDLFQEICTNISKATECTISIFDQDGIVRVSSDASRLGHYHQGAHEIMKGKVDFFEVPPDMHDESGMREGYNLPLEHEGLRFAVVGVAAELSRARSYAAIVKMSMEAIIKNVIMDRDLQRVLQLKVDQRTLELEDEIKRHKKTEAELIESRERFEGIAKSFADGFWETDANHCYTFVSNSTTSFIGLSFEEVIGRTRLDVFREWLTPKSLAAVTKVHELMERREEFRNITYEFLFKGQFFIFEISGHPAYDEQGAFIGYRGTSNNVTEKRRLEDALKHSEKMAGLGEMVAGVAHEINTPLGVCVTVVSHLGQELKLIKDKYQTGKMSRTDLDAFIQEAADAQYIMTTNLNRAAELVRSFKQVAVDQSSEHPRKFNLKEYISEVLTSLRPKLAKTQHQVVLECPDDLVLEARPDFFSHIITNFIMNSLIHGFADKVDGKIKIHIEVDAQRGVLKLNYGDNGCGMDEVTCDRIYEPFFTTKRGVGSGLGMHIIFNMVTDALQGTINCRSALGRGTRFDIVLPFKDKVIEWVR